MRKNTPNMTGMMPVMLPALASSSACCSRLPPDLPVCRQQQQQQQAAEAVRKLHERVKRAEYKQGHPLQQPTYPSVSQDHKQQQQQQ
jgi:hypothetical protein